MAEGIYSFRDLVVWKKSSQLTKDVYGFCQKLPKGEQYGLTSQIQRCAVSIPSNIAESQQRHNSKEFRQFLGIAKGSAAELEIQLLLAADIYKIESTGLINELHVIQKMLSCYPKASRQRTNHQSQITSHH